jgi:hypothetical protein
MKYAIIAAATFLFSAPAMAQAVNGLGFTPPATVPNFNNLGGVLGGVGQGIQSFTISDVNTIGVFHNTPGLTTLGTGAQFIIGLARPN